MLNNYTQKNGKIVQLKQGLFFPWGSELIKSKIKELSMEKKYKRWYDTNTNLAKLLNGLMKIHPKNEYRVIKGLVDLIKSEDPEILNNFVIPSDIEEWSRRWYDKEPIYWIAMNGLKNADKKLLKKVERYLEKELFPQ